MKNKTAKIKKKLLGLRFVDGLIFKVILYALLIVVSFVYLFPLLHMLFYSFKSLEDLLNPMVGQVPSKLYLKNFSDAYRTLAYFKTMGTSLTVTLLPALIQTFIVSLIGYGFARFDFRGKKIWLLLVIMTYIIPPQVVMIPRYVLFHQLGFLNSWLAIVIPAIFGQGLNSAIFILIFYQFFKQIPKVLDEAAQIDGAGRIYIYFKVAIPLSIPSFITSFLFSFVWYWNETYMAGLFLGDKVKTLQMRLQSFVSEYNAIFGGAAADFANEAIRMAATLLIILPMLIIYFILQRWFIEGIDKAGITGE